MRTLVPKRHLSGPLWRTLFRHLTPRTLPWWMDAAPERTPSSQPEPEQTRLGSTACNSGIGDRGSLKTGRGSREQEHDRDHPSVVQRWHVRQRGLSEIVLGILPLPTLEDGSLLSPAKPSTCTGPGLHHHSTRPAPRFASLAHHPWCHVASA